MKYKKIALLAAAALTMTQMLGISAAAEEDVSSAEDSVVDADSLGSDESSEESFTSGDYTYSLDGKTPRSQSTTTAMKQMLSYRTNWTVTRWSLWAAARLPQRIRSSR